MKRLLIALSLVCFATPFVAAQDATAEEIKRASDYLKKTSAALLAATAGLSEAQLNFKPAPTKWSVAEVAEHITAAEQQLFKMIRENVMNAPARAETVDVKEIDAFVLKVIPDRTNKVQAPEPLVPTKRFGGAQNTIKEFKEVRAKTLEFVTKTKGLRGHAMDAPIGKKLDAYQWVLFIAAHCDRHTQQINEVKGDAKFPKA